MGRSLGICRCSATSSLPAIQIPSSKSGRNVIPTKEILDGLNTFFDFHRRPFHTLADHAAFLLLPLLPANVGFSDTLCGGFFVVVLLRVGLLDGILDGAGAAGQVQEQVQEPHQSGG